MAEIWAKLPRKLQDCSYIWLNTFLCHISYQVLKLLTSSVAWCATISPPETDSKSKHPRIKFNKKNFSRELYKSYLFQTDFVSLEHSGSWQIHANLRGDNPRLMALGLGDQLRHVAAARTLPTLFSYNICGPNQTLCLNCKLFILVQA